MKRLLFAALFAVTACEKGSTSQSPGEPAVTESQRTPPGAKGDDDDVTIRAEKVSDDIYVLLGKGGNIGVQIGDDGVLMIDDQFAPLAPKIEAAIAELTDQPLRYLVNTHHHGDHTGGNPVFGAKATIVAHDNVRKHLVAEEKPEAGYPAITFDRSLTFHFNGDTVRATYFAGGHTDGDSVIFFEKANVVHTGDHFFNGRFPYIDLEDGGNPEKMMANIDALLAVIDDDTVVIPGHGEVGTKNDLSTYRMMLAESIATVRERMKAGKSLAQIQKAGVPARWKGWGSGFVTDDRWLEILYQGLGGN